MTGDQVYQNAFNFGPLIESNKSVLSFVDEVFKRAIEAGGTDDGSPEQKVETFYGGYVRDLDGNKLVFCKMGQ